MSARISPGTLLASLLSHQRFLLPIPLFYFPVFEIYPTVFNVVMVFFVQFFDLCYNRKIIPIPQSIFSAKYYQADIIICCFAIS